MTKIQVKLYMARVMLVGKGLGVRKLASFFCIKVSVNKNIKVIQSSFSYNFRALKFLIQVHTMHMASGFCFSVFQCSGDVN